MSPTWIIKVLVLSPLILLNSAEEAVHCDTYSALAKVPNPYADRGTKCCEYLGCFKNGKSSVWSQISQLPQCMDKIKPQFLLYTSKSAKEQLMDFSNLNSSASNLSLATDKELFVIVHGWNTKWPNNWMFPMKDALLNMSANVLLVRWTDGSNLTNYVQAAANSRSIGMAVAVVLKTMVDHKKADLSRTTIVGFSIGAHSAGFAGSDLPGLKRIIGLDPAGPLFACEDPEARLDQTDAKFVQVIHTNGETVLKFGHGTMQQMGHVDFYVNGGIFQSDCDQGGMPKAITDIFKLNLTAVWKSMSCSHHRSHDLFTEMVQQGSRSKQNGCKFVTFPCNDSTSWINGNCFQKEDSGDYPEPGVGLDFGTKFRGKYFFNVRQDGVKASEFCGQQYLVALMTDIDVKGDLYFVFEDISGESYTAQFQERQDVLPKNTLTSRVITMPRYFVGLKNVLLSYTKYASRLWKDGKDSFELRNASLTNVDGSTWHLCSKITIPSGNPVRIELNTCR